VTCSPPASSDCPASWSGPLVSRLAGGFAVYPAGGGLWNCGAVRGLTASLGWRTQRNFRSPSVGRTSTASTDRSLGTTARRARLPAVVTIVAVGSAFHRSSRQSTPVIAPAGSSVKDPIGSRAGPNSEPNSGRWSCTCVCCTVNRIALAPGSA
jgi:hypothetical protein